MEERKQLKQKSVGTRSEKARLKLQKDYRKKDMEVKRSLRKDKRVWANNIAQEAEDAAKRVQMKSVYDATRRPCSEPLKKIGAVRNKAGKLLTNEDEVRQIEQTKSRNCRLGGKRGGGDERNIFGSHN